MANTNFIVHNGLTVGPITVDAATGDMTGVGNLSLSNPNITSTSNANILLTPNGTGVVKSTASFLPNANATLNLGATSAYWNSIYGTATTALYADLAENYLADKEYEPGTVVSFGGKREIMMTDTDMDTRVAGVVSTNPAHLMNGGLEGNFVTPLALTGRVPTKVYGPVRKGDLMVSTNDGHARSEVEPVVGSVIGKALEHFDGDEGIIEVVVGRF